jgi:hypothetical protein
MNPNKGAVAEDAALKTFHITELGLQPIGLGPINTNQLGLLETSRREGTAGQLYQAQVTFQKLASRKTAVS